MSPPFRRATRERTASAAASTSTTTQLPSHNTSCPPTAARQQKNPGGMVQVDFQQQHLQKRQTTHSAQSPPVHTQRQAHPHGTFFRDWPAGVSSPATKRAVAAPSSPHEPQQRARRRSARRRGEAHCLAQRPKHKQLSDGRIRSRGSRPGSTPGRRGSRGHCRRRRVERPTQQRRRCQAWEAQAGSHCPSASGSGACVR